MIREMERKDIAAMTDVYNDAVLHSTATFDTEVKTIAQRTEWFEAHTGYHKIFVYEKDGEAVGYVSLSTYNPKSAYDSTCELSLYVNKSYRGQHIGCELMEAIIAYAKEAPEIHNIVSLITSTNEASIYLHKKYGFTYCGVINYTGVKFGEILNTTYWQLLV